MVVFPDPVTGAIKRPSRTPDEIFADVGEADLVKGQQAVGNQTKHQREVSTLTEDRDAKASFIAVGKAVVGASFFLNFLLIAFRGDLLHQGNGVVGLEDFGVKILQTAVEAKGGLAPHRQVKVGGIELDHGVKQTVDLNGGHKWLSVK